MKRGNSYHLDGRVSEYILTIEEIATLYQFLQWQYISYENLPLLTLVKQIREILAETCYEPRPNNQTSKASE